jgi:hypothetical protein
MKNKVAFETEVYVHVSDKLVQQDAEIQYYEYLCNEELVAFIQLLNASEL